MKYFNKKSKFTIFLLVMVLLVTQITTVASAANTPTISVSSGTAEPGETVTLDVSITNNPGITVMKLSLTYPSDLELTKVEETGFFEDCTVTHSDKSTAKPYILYWHGDLLKENITANGNIVKLTFKVKDSAKAGNYGVSVTPSDGEVYNADLEDVLFTSTTGKVKVVIPETTTAKTTTTTVKNETTTKRELTTKKETTVSNVSTTKSSNITTTMANDNGKLLEILENENVKSSFDSKIESGLKPYIVAEEGSGFYSNTLFVVDEVTKELSSDTREAIIRQLKTIGDDVELLGAFDLKLYLLEKTNGKVISQKEIQPTGKIKVTLPVPLDILEKYEKIALVHCTDEKAEVLDADFSSYGSVTFETDHFSYFAFVSDDSIGLDTEMDDDVQSVVDKDEQQNEVSSSITPIIIIAVVSLIGLFLILLLLKRRKDKDEKES